MQSIRRILVAVKDPGASVLPAIVKGTQLARAFGAELELFHAIDEAVCVDMLGTNIEGVQQLESQQRRDCLQRLERIAARVRLHTPTVSVAAEWDFPAYAAIVRRAIASGADLVVAEQHPGSHLAQGLLQLADWELLRLAPMPVLLVKNPQVRDSRSRDTAPRRVAVTCVAGRAPRGARLSATAGGVARAGGSCRLGGCRD